MAYETSKHMPGVLQFTLQPRQEVWPEPFHKDSPSAFDISFYFWADNFCRLREKYNGLLELMEKEDLSMQTRLDGVELLIFTSRQLPSESHRMHNQFYLWGVFLSLEGQHSPVALRGKQPNVTPNIDDPANVTHDVEDQVIDMEIDMVGGREVGIEDKFFRSNSSSARHVFGRVLSEKPIEKSTAPHLDHGVKREQCDDFDAPPGFLRPVTSDAAPKGPFSTSLMKMAPVPYKVDAPPAITLANMLPIAHKLDAPPGTVDKLLRSNSSAACLNNLLIPSNDVFAKVHSRKPLETRTVAVHLDHQVKREQCDDFGGGPGFSRPVTTDATHRRPFAISLMKMSPVSSNVDTPSAIPRGQYDDFGALPGLGRPVRPITSDAAHKGNFATSLMKMSPVSYKVDAPPAIPLMKMSPVLHKLDAPPGDVDKFLRSNSSAACSGNLVFPSQDEFARIPSAKPIENCTVATHINQVKRERYDDFDAPPGFSRPVTSAAAHKRPSLEKMSPVAHELDAPGFSKLMKLDERGSSSKGPGMHQEVASDEIACLVCGESYDSKPNDLLGIYSYSKRDTGITASTRGECVYTTVSHFSIIHFRCHEEAKADPKKEWESGTLCNCIFPLKGPLVPATQYARYVDQYWDNLSLLLGPADGTRLRVLTHDIVLMLARFATGASFNRESNGRFLPFMIQMAQYLVDQASSTQRQTMAKDVSTYLTTSSTKSSGTCVAFMMVNSVLSESYESWLTHRLAFLQRGIYHAYMQHKLTSKSRGNDDLFSIIQPMLVYTGLIEQLQRFFKSNNKVRWWFYKKKGDGWEVAMREKLVDVKEMVGFSKKLLSWVHKITSAAGLKEAFLVMGILCDVLSTGCEEDFVRAAVQGGRS